MLVGTMKSSSQCTFSCVDVLVALPPVIASVCLFYSGWEATAIWPGCPFFLFLFGAGYPTFWIRLVSFCLCLPSNFFLFLVGNLTQLRVQ